MTSMRLKAVVIAGLLLAVACSRQPPGPMIDDQGFGAPADGPATTAAAGTTTTPGTTTAAATSDIATHEASAIPVPAAAVTGIDGRTVNLVIHKKLQDCGNNASEASAAKANEGGLKVLDFYVRYFNDVILKPYGWKLAYKLVDDGGYTCPEKQQAAARRIVTELKPFAVIGLSGSYRGPVVADVVTRAGIRHIGISYSTIAELQKRRGLAWVIHIVAERSYEYLAHYIAKRIKGTQYTDPSTGLTSPRRYGMAVADLPEYRTLAGIMKSNLRRYGINLEQVYFVSPDSGVAAQQSLVTVQRMRQDGINSLIFDFFPQGFIPGTVLTQTMNSQNYLPDLLVGTYGLPVLDQLNNARVWARAQGTSASIPLALRSAIVQKDGRLDFDPKYENISENAVPWKDVWYHEDGGSEIENADPSPANMWNGLAIVALGLINHTGDRLTAQSWAEGVWSTHIGGPNRCGAWRLLGREYEFSTVWDFEDPPDGGLEHYTTVYWRNKQTLLTAGYWESFDNYRFFEGFDDLPPKATRDTGKMGDDIPHQKRVGVRAWTPCKTFGMTD